MFRRHIPQTIVVFFVLFLVPCVVRAQHCFVFAGSYNWDKTKSGLYVYELDTLNGQMKMRSSINDVLNPAYLTVSPNGKYVYACTEAQHPGGGAVSGYIVDAPTGTLSFINTQKSGGENPVYLTVHKNGKWLVNANYTGSSLSAYRLEANGVIAPACQVITFLDSSINRERQDRAHPHSAVFSPLQDHVYVPDLGADKIRCFSFDTSATQPLQPGTPPYTTTTPGSGPRHFTFHPNGRFCYCTEEMAGMVTVYTYANGRLDSIQRIATHKHKRRREHSNADIHISPDGRFLYASNRGKENSLAIFAVDRATGQLNRIAIRSVMGNHPRNFAIDPSGKFLLVANQFSGYVVVFRRDIATGLLARTGVKIKVPGVSCLQIKQYP